MNYDKLKSTARTLLRNFGQSMTLTRDVAGTYDPTTGVMVNTQQTFTDYGVVLPYGDGSSSVADSLIQQGDRQVFIQISTEPKTTDKITIAGATFNIVNVKPLEPAGINVLYELQVRK